MSVNSGPNIVTDGLIYYLDTASYRSLPAEPTVNLMPTWLDGSLGTGWSDYADSGGAGTYQILSDNTYGYKIQYTNTVGGGRYSIRFGASYTGSSKISISIYFKPLSWVDSNSRLHIYSDFYGGNGPYYQVGLIYYFTDKTITTLNYTENASVENIGNGWYRAKFTTIFNDSAGCSIHMFLYDTSIVELAWPQMEQKNYVTTFVDGTRNTWHNLGYESYNVSLFGSPKLDSGNGGNLLFDGITQYGILGDLSYNRTYFSVFAWFNFPVYHNSWHAAVISKWKTGSGTVLNEWYMGAMMSDGPSALGCQIQYNGDGNGLSVSTLDNYTSNTWYNIGFVFNDGLLSFYKNGDLVGNQWSGQSITVWTTTQPIQIATFYTDPLFRPSNIKIGNILIYNKSLSLLEIQQNYNSLKSRYGLI